MCLLYLSDINIETCQTIGILLPVRFTARVYFNMHRLEKPDALRWMHFHSQNLLQVVIQSRTHLTLLLCWLRMTQVLRTQHFDRPHFWPEVFDVVLKAVVCSRHPAIGSLALDPWNCWLVKVNGIEMMTHAVENTSVWYGFHQFPMSCEANVHLKPQTYPRSNRCSWISSLVCCFKTGRKPVDPSDPWPK